MSFVLAALALGLPVARPDGAEGTGTRTWGDIDCSGSLEMTDAVGVARALIRLPIGSTAPCPAIGSEVSADGIVSRWGDIDCDGGVRIGDAQKIARHLISLPVAGAAACPVAGDAVDVTNPPPGIDRLQCETATATVGSAVNCTYSFRVTHDCSVAPNKSWSFPGDATVSWGAPASSVTQPPRLPDGRWAGPCTWGESGDLTVAFASPGENTIELTVCNEVGCSTREVSLPVSPAP